jgi:prepilin-type N-terminal cleavage/methylation domain-containing protein
LGFKLIETKDKNGFSLIEFIIVMLILSVLFLFIVPKIESGTKLNINKSARRLAGAVIYIRNEVIFKKKNLRIMYDMEEHTYSIKEIVRTKAGFAAEEYEEKEVSTLSLEEGVRFMDIKTTYGGRLNFGKTYTHFFPTGMVEKTLIHLINENDAIKTLDVNVLTGEVDIFDDYYDEESY